MLVGSREPLDLRRGGVVIRVKVRDLGRGVVMTGVTFSGGYR